MSVNDHYFYEQPKAASRPRTWDVRLRGIALRLTSDEGVFSKRGVDPGSRLLVEYFRFPEMSGPLLDVGCGYGPIGLTLAKADPSRRVEMVDVNKRAVDLAARNAEQNGVYNAAAYESDLFNDVESPEYAAIVTNPPIRAGKNVVHRLFEQSYVHLMSGGSFWVVIRKKQGAPTALRKLQTVFPEVAIVKKKNGYVVIHSQK